MSYAWFLALFVGLPTLGLAALAARDVRTGLQLPPAFRTWPPAAPIALLVVVAVLYTTPWDNYLVATGVWSYDPDLVLGMTLGVVPIEEYAFFVIQTVFTGLLWLALARRLPAGDEGRPLREYDPARIVLGTLALTVAVGFAVTLVTDLRSTRYLALQASWALVPIAVQLGFGADILARRARVTLMTIAISTGYLALADSLAIASGTWTIAADQSLGWLLAGVLPVEEFTFFLASNSLVATGMSLLLSVESHRRIGLLPGASPCTRTALEERAVRVDAAEERVPPRPAGQAKEGRPAERARV